MAILWTLSQVSLLVGIHHKQEMLGLYIRKNCLSGRVMKQQHVLEEGDTALISGKAGDFLHDSLKTVSTRQKRVVVKFPRSIEQWSGKSDA